MDNFSDLPSLPKCSYCQGTYGTGKTGKTGKKAKKNPCQGIWKFCKNTGKTQGILLAQVVNSLILKAYIPLRRKNNCVGSWRWLRPPTPEFRVGDTNMLVSENAKPPTPNPKCASPRRQTLNFALPPTQTPDASQWNIGGVGSPTQNFRVGHVHFICVGHPTQTQFPVEYGLLRCKILRNFPQKSPKIVEA